MIMAQIAAHLMARRKQERKKGSERGKAGNKMYLSKPLSKWLATSYNITNRLLSNENINP